MSYKSFLRGIAAGLLVATIIMVNAGVANTVSGSPNETLERLQQYWLKAYDGSIESSSSILVRELLAKAQPDECF